MQRSPESHGADWSEEVFRSFVSLIMETVLQA
jgi:hypothetical protein